MADVTFVSADQGPNLTSRCRGVVKGQPVEVLIPQAVFTEVEGADAQLEQIVLPALEREASGKDHPWGEVAAAIAAGEEPAPDEYLCPAPDCDRSEPGKGWRTAQGRDRHVEREHAE